MAAIIDLFLQAERLFVHGPVAWNSLPVDLRSPDISEDVFRKKLRNIYVPLPHCQWRRLHGAWGHVSPLLQMAGHGGTVSIRTVNMKLTKLYTDHHESANQND